MNIRTVALNPWSTLSGFRDLQREMTRIFDGASRIDRTARYPLVNVLGNSDGAILSTEIPGMDPADIEIHLIKDQLTIAGTVRNEEPEAEGVTYLRRERANGSFTRSFTLPFEVEENGITAEYDKGVLEIRLPRAEKSKPRTIPVTTV